jgi:hypothetical protein
MLFGRREAKPDPERGATQRVLKSTQEEWQAQRKRVDPVLQEVERVQRIMAEHGRLDERNARARY